MATIKSQNHMTNPWSTLGRRMKRRKKTYQNNSVVFVFSFISGEKKKKKHSSTNKLFMSFTLRVKIEVKKVSAHKLAIVDGVVVIMSHKTF